LGNNIDTNVFTEVTDLIDKNITAIAAYNSHSLALSDNGKVYAAGYNYYGQFGLGNNTNTNVFIEAIDLSN
jgi:alpha-tubulin suppressor-like RCC1 family protein